MAAPVSPNLSGCPSTVTVPLASGRSPNSALASVERPDPTSPATPTISPRPTAKRRPSSLRAVRRALTSRTMSAAADAVRRTVAPDSTGSDVAGLAFDISADTAAMDVSRGSSGPMRMPSLTMLSRLASLKISAMRWLM